MTTLLQTIKGDEPINIGEAPTFEMTFRDKTGALIDPSIVKIRAKKPSTGTVVEKTYALGEITRIGQGVYECVLPVDEAGTWRAKAIGDTIIEQFQFIVEEDLVG